MVFHLVKTSTGTSHYLITFKSKLQKHSYFLMMPIATTFAKNASLLGCDGRPISQMIISGAMKNPFNLMTKWRHQTCPSTFSNDYNDYYTQHCESLRQQIEFAEAHGFTFNCSAYTYSRIAETDETFPQGRQTLHPSNI